jgi:hypothetical protein
MSDAPRLRVLYLAFYFPPAAGGGVQRTLHMVRHLPDLGIDVEALAPSDPKWLAEDPGLLAALPPTLRVHRVRYRGPGTRVLPAERMARATGSVERARARLAVVGRQLLQPDVESVWLADAVPAGRRLLASGRFDAIVTTSPPASVAIAGSLLARSSGLPWIADWRDAWLGSAELLRAAGRDRARLAVLRRMAARTLASCSAAACVNEQIAWEVGDLAPRAEIEVIPNGAAFDAVEGLERRPADRCTLLYAGYFFGSRSPEPLLAGAAELLARRPELRSALRLRFMGGLRPRDVAAVEAHALADVVEYEPNRPYREALQAQRDADALVLLTQAEDGQDGAVFVPGKTWEYLTTARPILAVVPEDGHAAATLRDLEAPATIVDPADTAGVGRALESLVERWRAGDLPDAPLPDTSRDRISRRARAEALAGLVRRAVERRAAAAAALEDAAAAAG